MTNSETGNHATVGGGRQNTASEFDATVGGGQENTACGVEATVGGGFDNIADGQGATVGGGQENTATADGTTIPGGTRGAAEGAHSFVWNDATEYHEIPDTDAEGLSSSVAVDGEPVTGSHTFTVSATGGVRFVTGTGSSPRATYIPSDSAGWATSSSRAVKTDIDPVDPREALAGVDSLSIATWEYEDGTGTGTTHIGPMAEEFHDAFDVGSSDDHINSVDIDGVALAAIQGLSTALEERTERIDALEADNDRQTDRIAELEATVETQREQLAERDDRIAALETRLAALEDELAGD